MSKGPLGDVPSLLRDARLRARLTQSGAAHRAGISPRSLRHYENGEITPTTDVFQRLLIAYGIKTPGELCKVLSGSTEGSGLAPDRIAASLLDEILVRVQALEKVTSETAPALSHPKRKR